MEKLKNENKFLREENEVLGREKANRQKMSLDLEKQLMEGQSRLEGEEFRNRLQEEQIEKLKVQVMKLQKKGGALETEREQYEESWEEQKQGWERERGVKEEQVKLERRKRVHLENKLGAKDEFIEKLLDMLKMPLSGYRDSAKRLGDSADFLEDDKRVYQRILEELQMRYKQERIKDLFEMQKNMSPMGKEGGSGGDMEIEQQIIQLKKSLEARTREVADLKRKAGLRETELTEEVKALGKQVEELKADREKAVDKAKKFRSLLKETEESLEEEEDRNKKRLYEVTKNLKEKEYQLKVTEHELGMKDSELEEKRGLTESLQDAVRELKVENKRVLQKAQEMEDELKGKGRFDKTCNWRKSKDKQERAHKSRKWQKKKWTSSFWKWRDWRKKTRDCSRWLISSKARVRRKKKSSTKRPSNWSNKKGNLKRRRWRWTEMRTFRN